MEKHMSTEQHANVINRSYLKGFRDSIWSVGYRSEDPWAKNETVRGSVTKYLEALGVSLPVTFSGEGIDVTFRGFEETVREDGAKELYLTVSCSSFPDGIESPLINIENPKPA
jgi:hypothetical protein